MNARAVNWFGLAGGITTILLIIVSINTPWWRLTIGNGVFQVDASPINLNLNLIGNVFTIPLIWAFNLASILLLAASGVALTVYSLYPSKSYSKRLLSFGYKKPFYAVVFFTAALAALTFIAKSILGVDLPFYGSSSAKIPFGGQEASIEVLTVAEFIWPFWLGIVAAGLCVAARLYHKKLEP
jgi:hypothetical protein